MEKLLPEVVLSKESRDRCVRRLKQIPTIIYSDPTQFAAVLVPLCVVSGEMHILYTLRSKNLRKHSGQISFPGGMADNGETAIETALRETEEEIGISPDNIEIWTEMSPMQGTAQAVVITPVLGFIKNFNNNFLNPNVSEVEEVITVPLRHLCDSHNQGFVVMSDKKVPLPLYVYDNHFIWGVTGLITHFVMLNLLHEDVYNVSMSKKYKFSDVMASKL